MHPCFHGSAQVRRSVRDARTWATLPDMAYLVRRLWFEGVMSCRRRLGKTWEKTPLRQVFFHKDLWSVVKLGCMVARLRAAVSARELQTQDAFMLVDTDNNGLISLDEVFGSTPPDDRTRTRPLLLIRSSVAQCLSGCR